MPEGRQYGHQEVAAEDADGLAQAQVSVSIVSTARWM